MERLMSQIKERPSETLSTELQKDSYVVIVYDNDKNTVEEVVMILMAATRCSLEEAEIETWEVHHLGKSVVHHGSETDCSDAAKIIRQIGIRVEVVSE
jgi:ATP-dependent Clp protease adapter protein ClpS